MRGVATLRTHRVQMAGLVVLAVASGLLAVPRIVAARCYESATLKVFEFHPDRIRVIDAFLVRCDPGPDRSFWLSGSGQYETGDLLSTEISGNARVVTSRFVSESWRGTYYTHQEIQLAIAPAGPGETPVGVAVARTYKRLPHLHTMDPLRPGVAQHFGVNVEGRWVPGYYVFAIPESAQLLDFTVVDPDAVVSDAGWTALVYAIRPGERQSLHFRFRLHEDVPDRPLDLCSQWLQNLVEWWPPLQLPPRSQSDLRADVARSLARLRPPVPVAVDGRGLLPDDPIRTNPDGPPIRARIQAPGYVVGRPVMTGSYVAMSIANRLLFLDVGTGAFGPGTGVPGLLSTGPVVDGDLLLAGTAEYRLYALDRTTFDVRWVFTAGGAVSGPPVATADRVFVGCADGRLYALDRATGALAWSRPLGEPDLLGFTASPVAADGDRIAVASIQGEVALLDAASGLPAWEVRVADVVLAAPVLTPTLVVVADVTGIVHGLDRATGRTVWTTGLAYPIYGDPVQVGRDTVFVTNGGLVSRLDTATGTIRWEQFLVGLDGLQAAAPAGDDLVVVTGSGDLVILLDGGSGDVRWFQHTAGKKPVSQPVAGPGLAVIQSGQVIEVIEWNR